MCKCSLIIIIFIKNLRLFKETRQKRSLSLIFREDLLPAGVEAKLFTPVEMMKAGKQLQQNRAEKQFQAMEVFWLSDEQSCMSYSPKDSDYL